MQPKQPLKIFTDPTHYSRKNRTYLSDMLRPYWNDRNREQNRQLYGSWIDSFALTNSIDEADVCLLPMVWAYYIDKDNLDRAYNFVDQAESFGKVTVVISLGDHYIDIPLTDRNVVIFQASLYQSKRKQKEFALPPFFKDNVEIYRNGEPNYRSKQTLPTVGFCGNATESLMYNVFHGIRNLIHAVRYALDFTPFKSAPIVPAPYFRARVLKSIAASSQVEANFILRDRYWAGVDSKDRGDPYNQAQVEYIRNLDQSEYIIAIRGGGNWSKRFYEALNWGRIPVFIDTDCVLPYDFAIDWKRYCVWIDRSEIEYAAEKIADFHAQLTNDDFIELQVECRRLWKEWLSMDGFHKHFLEHPGLLNKKD